MKITKLPDSCDPAKMIQDQNRKIFSVCPCCGESRKFTFNFNKLENGDYSNLYGGVEQVYYVNSKGWHGPAKGDWLGWLIPSRQHYWHIDSYKCHTCGAEWDSDPYPTDIDGLR